MMPETKTIVMLIIKTYKITSKTIFRQKFKMYSVK